MTGADRFFLGNTVELYNREKEIKERQTKIHYGYLLDLLAKQNGEKEFEPHRYPMVFQSFFGKPCIVVSDPDIVRELFTTKNQLTDKRGNVATFMSDFMGKSFLFSKNDEVWKQKRQACAHAFYKDKLK